MSGADFLLRAAELAMGIQLVAIALTLVRILRGPTLPDRVLALDLLSVLGIGMVCTISLYTGVLLYLDIAIALGLVGFLATVAFARYIMIRGQKPARSPTQQEDES